jgi:two-component sensor histidine kinase
LRVATEAGKVGLWDWDIDADRIVWTDSLYAVHGIDKADFTQTFEDWIGRVHSEDRAAVLAAIDSALKGEAAYEIELRTLRPDGGETWIYTNAVVLRDGDRPVRMVGASVDITSRKQGERERALLVAELSHRVKNTLATVMSIARQSFSRNATVESARRSFEGRVRALAQTHTRLAETNWSMLELRTLLDDELAPYRTDDGSNVVLSGQPVRLTPKQAVVLGMAFHELSTNAAKYGAFSVKCGKVLVDWRPSSDGASLEVVWTELGGPTVIPPAESGFGRLLLERALAADLRGSVALDFRPEGLACRIVLPLETVSLAATA